MGDVVLARCVCGFMPEEAEDDASFWLYCNNHRDCQAMTPSWPTQAQAAASWNAMQLGTAREERLREALRQCADQFQFYADEHTKAGKHEKSVTNWKYARLARAALDGAAL